MLLDGNDPAAIDRAAAFLARGELVAFATETVYGLGARADDDAAVAKIFAAKGRPSGHPLIVHVLDAADAERFADELSPLARRLVAAFWPGPLTIIVKAGSRLPLRVTAYTGNVALRVPECNIPRAIAKKLGLPITATSANLQGLPECTYAACVKEQIGDQVPLIVDGGPTGRTVPTTIVDLSGGGNSWMILREGAIPTHEIALALQR